MERFERVRYVVFLCFVLCMIAGVSYAEEDSLNEEDGLSDVVANDGLYETITDDGYVLKMKRYRPTTGDVFNVGRQPVLLFPGIFCNMNEFLAHTPEKRIDDYEKMVLPETPASWATGDPHIAEDPMRYYSLAYYLWSKGFDPWLANFRGTGRGEFKSDRGAMNTNFDVWAAFDVPACINKVYDVTNIHPFIGGHSTGAMVCYFYLQGIYMDPAEMEGRYIPHVKSDLTLAQQRNTEIKGFIGLDPVAIPPFTDIGRLDAVLYPILAMPLYIPVDGLVGGILSPILPNRGIMLIATDLVFGIISGLDDFFDNRLADRLSPELDIFGFANFWEVKNTDDFVQDYFARYGVSSTYLRCIAQCLDFWMQDTVREHWMNGEENKNRICVPDANPGEDGYYYYLENMALMSVPAIVLLSDNDSIVVADEVIEDIMGGKTASAYDRSYIVPDSAHMDVVVGLNAPSFSFPKIGAWLNAIISNNPDIPEDPDDPEDPEDPEDPDIPAEGPGSITPVVPSAPATTSSKSKGDDDSACFISTLN